MAKTRYHQRRVERCQQGRNQDRADQACGPAPPWKKDQNEPSDQGNIVHNPEEEVRLHERTSRIRAQPPSVARSGGRRIRADPVPMTTARTQAAITVASSG